METEMGQNTELIETKKRKLMLILRKHHILKRGKSCNELLGSQVGTNHIVDLAKII